MFLLSQDQAQEHPRPPPPHQHQYSSVLLCPPSVLSLSGRVEVETIDEALALATPTHEHQNNQRLFLLARALLCIERRRGAKLTVAELKVVFDRWYQRAAELGLLRAEESKDKYFEKFMTARRYARKPLGPILDFARLLEVVDATPLPPEAELFEDERARRLVGLCRVLQAEAGDQPFYLSCRTAAFVLGVEDHHTTASWLFCLVSAGVLIEVSKGAGMKASRYRYNQPTVQR